MIPSTSGFLDQDFEIEEQPDKTYKIHIENNMIRGFTDERDAVQQAIYKILNTERYQYIMYSWDYGIELDDLFGEPVSYVCPELKRRISEALLQDTRIESVDTFEFEVSKGVVRATFTAHTIYGDIQAERAVNF